MKETLKTLILSLLRQESVAVLKKYKPKIVAITGTVGKTSTKDATAAALEPFVHVRKTPKNFNTEFGIPLTILDAHVPASAQSISGWLSVLAQGLDLLILPNHYPEWLVLEVGTDRPGDIEAITKWLKPDVVIVTRLSEVPVHVENFGSPQDIYKEKGNLVRALKPGGTLILNADDPLVMQYKDETSERVLTYGRESADLSAEDYAIRYDESHAPCGIAFSVKDGTEVVPVILSHTLGEQHIQQVLAALTVVKLLGQGILHAVKALEHETPSPGRMRIIEGVNGSTLIDDTYNSSPVAAEEALKTLGEIEAERKIAVLGDMLELGEYSAEEHKRAGERAKTSADVIVSVGPRSRTLEGTFHFQTSQEAGEWLKGFVAKGDVVLVKGSQGVRMERVVEAAMAHPEKKKKLLVRMDEEWERR